MFDYKNYYEVLQKLNEREIIGVQYNLAYGRDLVIFLIKAGDSKVFIECDEPSYSIKLTRCNDTGLYETCYKSLENNHDFNKAVVKLKELLKQNNADLKVGYNMEWF